MKGIEIKGIFQQGFFVGESRNEATSDGQARFLIDKGKAALTELFNSVKNSNTPVIVDRIVNDIDDIVRIVRFDGWKDTVTGRKEVKKALRSVVSVKYKIKDREVFDKAYGYVEQYY